MDGHALKGNNHNTEDRIKGNTYDCFTEALNGNFEGERKTGEYQECDAYTSVTNNFKKTPFFLGKNNESKRNSV